MFAACLHSFGKIYALAIGQLANHPFAHGPASRRVTIDKSPFCVRLLSVNQRRVAFWHFPKKGQNVRPIFLSALVGLAITASIAPAMADLPEECVKAVTQHDLISVQSSDIVRMASFSMLDKAKSGNDSKNAGVTIPIDGVPVTLSYAEAQAYAERMLQINDIHFDEDQRQSIVMSVMAAGAPEMLKDCLDAKKFDVSYPKSAVDSPSFDIKLKWKPGHPVVIPRIISVHVQNGTYKVSKRFLLNNSDTTISVKKSGQPGDITAVSISMATYILRLKFPSPNIYAPCIARG